MSDVLPAHLARGQKTRERLMDSAVEIATREGLEALTIGRLADAAGIAKASVLGHYTSKEALQLATVDDGVRRFVAQVVLPASQAPAGIPRLVRLLHGWMEHMSACQGGCFFASAAAEFDGRPGTVRDRVRSVTEQGLQLLLLQIREAQRLKQIADKVDPEQLCFELHAVLLELNLRQQLLADARGMARARAALDVALARGATPSGRRLLRGKGHSTP